MTTALVLMLAALATGARLPTERQLSLPELAELLHIGITVTPPESASGLSWLCGRWNCTDRALRSPFDDASYVRLDTVEVDPEGIHPSMALHSTPRLAGGYTIYLNCRFVAEVSRRPGVPRFVIVEFHRDAFSFEMPLADFFTLKRDPSPVPAWFVLEHQITGDVLLFRRLPPAPRTDADEPK